MDTQNPVSTQSDPKAETAQREAPAGGPPAKKDSTIELPMFDLDEAINFVSQIQGKALEAAPMPEVAKGMGYTHPSSTPFYRRTTAARLFGLLGSSRAELTHRAREYLKPTSENSRKESVTEAILGIPLYAEEVQKHLGKKLNVQFVANSFAKALGLSDGCAATCARAFESSLKTAGMLAGDGTVSAASTTSDKTPEADPQAAEEASVAPKPGMKSHTLPLSKDGSRVITISAPLDITPKEIKRIQRWMEVTLLIDWVDEGDPL